MLVIALFVIPVNVNIAGNQDNISDLSIEISGCAPSRPQENNVVKITSVVSNLGTETVENISIQFNCDLDNNTIIFENLELLEPGKSASIEIDWMAIEGSHTIIAVVDPYNNILEQNQKNNIDRLKIIVEPGNEETSITYGDNIKYERLSNGLTRATIPYPTVYNDLAEIWEPMDLDLQWDNGRSEWQTKKSRFNAFFKTDVIRDRLFRFEIDNDWVEYDICKGKMNWKNDTTEEYISGATAPQTKVGNNKINYGGVFNGTSISYKMLPFGVKECFILNCPPENNVMDKKGSYLVYTGELRFSENLTMWVDDKNCANKGFRTSSKIEFRGINESNAIFSFIRPFAYDSDTSTSFTECFYEIRIVGESIQFDLCVPADWVLSPNRVYPIYIDPTIVTEYPMDDSFVRSWDPDHAYGTIYELCVDAYTDDICRPFIKFDLSGIPSGSTISSALFSYYYRRKYTNDPVGRTNNLHKITGSWDEDTLTWNNKPGYNPTVFSSYVIPGSFGWIETDITQYVQDKIDGETDYGFMVKDQYENYSGCNLCACMRSRENESYSPKLVIEYYSPGNGGSPYTWREGESWNRSYDSQTTGSWNILSTPTASDGYYTRQQSESGSGDWAEWDFMVNTAGTYYFWVRARYYYYASSSVRLLWSGSQIGSDQSWKQDEAEWVWTCFGSKYLSIGSGTLRITNPNDRYWVFADNILITSNSSYVPTGTGLEGLANYTIGEGGAPSTTEYSWDFEQTLGAEWTNYSSTGYGRNERTTYSHYSGSYSWRMDVTENYHSTLNELILHIDVNDATFLNLEFYTKNYGDEQNYMPSTFSDHSNTDGIAVSSDGENWVKLWQYDYSIGDWENCGPFDIADKISISGIVYIKFQQYDDCMISSQDGILWDDITLETDGVVSSREPAFTWREAESWDRSWDSSSGGNWVILDGDSCSNNQYTRQEFSPLSYDWAEWDFTVITSGTYYFWVRVFYYAYSCRDVRLYWDDEQIGDSQNWYSSTYYWEWSLFGSKELTVGDGILKIKGYNNRWIFIDNILITDDPSYTPWGKETEGSTNDIVGGSVLDYNYIFAITKELSQVIQTAYDPSDIKKGRAFGSDGENYAAEWIIKREMNTLGLDYVGLEQIQQIDSLYDVDFRDYLNGKLEVSGRSLNISILEEPAYSVDDFYISPKWEEVFKFYTNNSNYDYGQLNKNFIEEGVKVYHTIQDQIWIDEFIDWLIDTFLLPQELEPDDFDGYNDFFNYFCDKLEGKYPTLDLGTLNSSNVQQYLPEYYAYFLPNPELYAPTFSSHYVFIEEDPVHNPNYDPPAWTQIELPCVFFNWLKQIREQLRLLLWDAILTRCVGLIRYDFNDNTYDMNLNYAYSLPVIYITKQDWESMEDYIGTDNCLIDFTLNQAYVQPVESYNVIGQINGVVDDSKTVIIGCLYDSWWNQGTADAAIGVGILLAIAKYFDDKEIEPKYNVKFVAYGGEEYGLKGAYYHEVTHRGENPTIVTVIDLNQLGFKQLTPRERLTVISNSENLNDTVSGITGRTDYASRTGDTADFETITTDVWDPPSDYFPFYTAVENGNRTACDTICFIKENRSRGARWVLHHRSGLEHTEGDSMKYYDPIDVSVTGEMIWNVTKHFTVDI